jgi:hypothetical protein
MCARQLQNPQVEFAAGTRHSCTVEGRAEMLFSGGFTFSNFLADVLSIFIFVLWFWLLITIFGDVFRRQDISGWAKSIWVIVLIVFSYLGIFIYLITQHRGMAERQSQRVEQAREDLRHLVGFSVADEIEKLERLKNSNVISTDEYTRLRARVVQ